MRFWRSAARVGLPATVRSALGLARSDRVLAVAVEQGGDYGVASRYAVSLASADGRLWLQRSWAEVDAGSWRPETATLTLSWADGSAPAAWTFDGRPTLFPEAVRERVQASVVLSRRIELADRRSARVAVRRDLATGVLSTQVILGRRVSADDPAVRALVDATLADLRDQVGLPPATPSW